jgi:hypothetical protein
MYAKIPNIFRTDNYNITQGLHTQGWGNMSDSVSIDFGYTGELIAPFNGCEVKTYPGSDNGQQSYFTITLPDGSMIICVHGFPVRSGMFNKGETIGNCRWHHWHISMIVNGQLDCILKYLEKLPMATDKDCYGQTDHPDGFWSSYEDKTLLLPDSALPNVPTPPPVVTPPVTPPMDWEIKYRTEKDAIRAVFEDKQFKALPGDDNNDWGYHRGTMDGNDNMPGAVRLLMGNYRDFYNETNTKVAGYETALKGMEKNVITSKELAEDYKGKLEMATKAVENSQEMNAEAILEINKLKVLPSNKNFLDSKKIKAMLITHGANLGVLITYLRDLGVNPDLTQLAIKTLATLGIFFGLTWVGGKYIETQGQIDIVKQNNG